MPIYEYKCGICNLTIAITKTIDEYQSELPCENLKEASLDKCPGTMTRVFTTPPGIIFEGGGWGCKNS